MPKHRVPDFPYVEARNVGMPQVPTAIVLRLSGTTSRKGAALGIANYQHGLVAPLESHHFILDEASTYRCIDPGVQAYASPFRAISVLMCAQPHEYEPLWEDATASPVLRRAAELVADLSLAHRIRPVYLDETRWFKHRWRRRGGLMVRVQGTWPGEAFIDSVQSYRVIKSEKGGLK